MKTRILFLAVFCFLADRVLGESTNIQQVHIAYEVKAFQDSLELPSGFKVILINRIDNATTNRFTGFSYLKNLRREAEKPLWHSASDSLKSAINDGLGRASREYFVDDLLALEQFQDWLADRSSGKFARFVVKTLSGYEERDQISSPFHLGEEGLPFQDYGFSNHKFNFGLRPFSVNNPYAFAGYTWKDGGRKILAVSSRCYLDDWNGLSGEVYTDVPISESWAVGVGLGTHAESRRFWSNNSRDSRSFTTFLGLHGPFGGGQVFLSTGYPAGLTVLYQKNFW